jgi:hypothetical protein
MLDFVIDVLSAAAVGLSGGLAIIIICAAVC